MNRGLDYGLSASTDQAGIKVSDEGMARARMMVAAHANDADDCADLLMVLGLNLP